MNPKLLLFDIDGTLISARGIPKIAMGNVLSRKYSTFKYDSTYDFSGRTDPEIVENLLRYDDKEISDDLVEDILTEFCIELDKEFSGGHKPLIHSGVKQLILELAGNNYPAAVHVHPDGKYVYVSNWGDGSISVINTDSYTVEKVIKTGKGSRAFGQFISHD